MLSQKALKDLRIAFDTSYGEGFSDRFTEEDLEHIGMLLLTILAESLKMKIREEKKTLGVDARRKG